MRPRPRTLLLLSLLASLIIPGRMAAPAPPSTEEHSCNNHNGDPEACPSSLQGPLARRLASFAESARRVHIPSAGQLCRRATAGVWRALKGQSEQFLHEEGHLEEGSVGRRTRGVGKAVWGAVGPAWARLGVWLEAGGDVLVAGLSGLRKALTLLTYWAAVATHVTAAVLSPCKPFGPLDCGDVQASVVGKAKQAQSASLRQALRLIRSIGSRLNTLSNDARVYLIRRFLAQRSPARVREMYALANGRKVAFVRSILQFLTEDVRVEAVGPMPRGVCAGGEGCYRAWVGHEGIKEVYSKVIEKLQSFALRLDESTFIHDPIKNCVHVGGTSIGLTEQGEQVQGAFDHLLCFNPDGKVQSMRLNWNDTPQKGVRTDSG